MISRRDFVLGAGVSAIAAPFTAAAQPTGKMYRIGYLDQGYPSTAPGALEGFRQGLRELGYVEGRNLLIEFRWGELDFDRLQRVAAELVQLKVDVIAAVATRAIEAAKQATTTIPIVMTLSLHAVESGFVASLARPGGNVTGMTGMAPETTAKELGLLKEALPKLSRLAVLWNPAFYNKKREPQWREIEVAAPRLGVTLHSAEVRALDDFESAFASAARNRANAVMVLPDPLTFTYRERIAQLAAKHRLPTSYRLREYVEAGGLMSYGTSMFDSSRRAAAFVDKILSGAKPGDLPVEQATKFEFVISMKTAKALGLTIPPSLLLRADQVIE